MLVAVLGGCSPALPDAWFGAYRLADGRLVSLRESTPETLRLRVFDDGETRRYALRDGRWEAGEGLTPDSLSGSVLDVDGGVLSLTFTDGRHLDGRILELPTRTQVLETNGVSLFVRLTLPQGAGPHPAIVIAHGSGDDAATRTYATPDFFAAHGIAAVVYDKRGTGRSGGSFSMDFHQLADDLAGVADWVAEQPEVDAGRIGVAGYSQGGWIGPLAASRSTRLGFVIASYGMIDSPRDEARIETEQWFQRRGFDATAVAEAGELADAGVDVVASGFTDWVRFDALAERFRDRAWMQQLDRTLADLLRWPHWLVRLVGPYVTPPGLRWDYDSLGALDLLAARDVPSAWLIASHDTSAPNAFTLAELERRRRRGEPVRVRVFDATDHGFLLFQEDSDGARRYGNFHPDYFRSEVSIARRLAGLDPEP